jgi:hypothetical protein
LAESAKFEMSAFNKTYSGLIGKCLEKPNAPYLNVVAHSHISPSKIDFKKSSIFLRAD